MDIEKRLNEMVRSLEIEMLERAYRIPQGPPGPPITAEQLVRDVEFTMRQPTVLVLTLYGEAAQMMPKGHIIYQDLPTWQQEIYRKEGKKITVQIFIRNDDEADVLAGFHEKGILYELAPNVRRRDVDPRAPGGIGYDGAPGPGPGE